MDPASAFSAATRLVQAAETALRWGFIKGHQYREDRFGFFTGNLLYYLRIVDTEAIQTTHWNINCWSDEEVLRWKQSHIASCNAIAVAVSRLVLDLLIMVC